MPTEEYSQGNYELGIMNYELRESSSFQGTLIPLLAVLNNKTPPDFFQVEFVNFAGNKRFYYTDQSAIPNSSFIIYFMHLEQGE